MKKLVIAVALLIIVTGIAIAVLKALSIGFFEPGAEEPSVVEEPLPEPPRFVTMEPLVIPLFQGDRTAGTIQIQVQLETTGSANERLIYRALTKLHDTFLRDLYDFVPRMLRHHQRMDISLLKARLQLMTERVLPPGIIDDILIQSVVDNPA